MKSISILLLTKAIELSSLSQREFTTQEKTEERMPVGKEPGQNGTKEAEARQNFSMEGVVNTLEHYKVEQATG